MKKAEYDEMKVNLITNVADGTRMYYTKELYCVIDEMDIRFYTDKSKRWFMSINTYPINPREVLKMIDYVV